MAATLTQGGQARTYTLDPSQDRILATDDGTTQHLNTYTDSSDNPAWTTTQPLAVPARTPANTSWQRNITGPDGTLAGTTTNDGTTTWNITDPQGSTIATTPDTGTTPTPGTTWTEYGTPRDPTKAGTYGWLATHQRSADTLAGLTLMGVRLYNPTTGRFLSVDAIYGGNNNPYVYPPDPVGLEDPTGQASVYTVYKPIGVQPCTCGGVGGTWRWWGYRAYTQIPKSSKQSFTRYQRTGANLAQQLSLQSARSRPWAGKWLKDIRMTDPRFHWKHGWVKMQQVFYTYYGRYTIHYVYNQRTGKAMDFKFTK